jgi:hypothetical protein
VRGGDGACPHEKEGDEVDEIDLDEPVGYAVLPVGTPVVTSDGASVGTVREVRYHEREQILDGLMVEAPDGIRFVDAPEVGDMTRRKVDIALSRLDFLMLPSAPAGGGAAGESAHGALHNLRRGLGA